MQTILNYSATLSLGLFLATPFIMVCGLVAIVLAN